MLLTLLDSSNFGRIHVEDWVSLGVFDLTESLIGRILGEGALSPHRGNRRCMPCGPVPLELLELMQFIHPMMMLRRVMMSMRLRRAHLHHLFSSHCCRLGIGLLSDDLSGLLCENVLETFFVPNEGIVNLSGLSEHYLFVICC